VIGKEVEKFWEKFRRWLDEVGWGCGLRLSEFPLK
jgi:hypothetical protein